MVLRALSSLPGGRVVPTPGARELHQLRTPRTPPRTTKLQAVAWAVPLLVPVPVVLDDPLGLVPATLMCVRLPVIRDQFELLRIPVVRGQWLWLLGCRATRHLCARQLSSSVLVSSGQVRASFCPCSLQHVVL